MAVAAAAGVSAHRRDEYLQAARLAIEPARVDVELDLTPGIALAEGVVAEIDRNRDGVVSGAEARAYAAVVERDTELALDGRPLPRQLVEVHAPAVAAMIEGVGTLRLRWTAPLPDLAPGMHRLRFENAHHPDIGVYLANVLVPSSDRVAIVQQDRDAGQRQFSVEYTLRPRPVRAIGVMTAGCGGLVAALIARAGRRRRFPGGRPRRRTAPAGSAA
jgi:hypothetical protein